MSCFMNYLALAKLVMSCNQKMNINFLTRKFANFRVTSCCLPKMASSVQSDLGIRLSTLSLDAIVDDIVTEVSSGCANLRLRTGEKSNRKHHASERPRTSRTKPKIHCQLPICSSPTSPLYHSDSPTSVKINTDRALNSCFRYPRQPVTPPVAIAGTKSEQK